MTIEVLAEPAPPEPPPPPPEPLRPVAGAERVEIIDIVRGIALFGILAANIRGFAGPASTYFLPHLFWPALHDRVAQAFVDAFIQGKFITIFAVLFGVGFGVQAERALARAGRFNWTWARRCFVLLLFGLAHGLLIWFGDILLVYALTGFILLLFRRRKDKTVLIWAIIFYCIPLVMMTGLFVGSQLGQELPPMKPPTAAEIQQARETFADGTWQEIQQARSLDVVTHNWNFFFFMVWHILALFLFGLLLWRKRFFQPSPESLPRYRTLMLVALALGLIGNVAMVAMKWAFDPPMMPTTIVSYGVMLLQFLAVPLLSLGYVCAVILLVHDPRWHTGLQRFAYIGRTAFSNYLLQSVVGTLIFYNYGLGLFGRLGPALLLPLTVAVFALQVFVSRWWLARYRFGPMEWVWRKLTYNGPLPMRIPLPHTAALEARPDSQ
jgi:uncharacterized protein